MYQHTWHGIDLTSLAASSAAFTAVAGPEFYAEFYALLAAGHGQVDPGWVENKRSLGREMISFFTDWQHRNGHSPRILALAVGKAVTEGLWLQEGFEVTFNECQSDSLKELRQSWPEAKTLIGDAMTLQPADRYDIVTLIALDCALSHDQMQQLLERIKSWLEADGEMVVYCTNTLNWRQLARELVKHVIGRYRRQRHVVWGWWRSPSEFLKLARQTGLKATTYSHHGGKLIERPRWRAGWMSWSSPHLTVVYRREELC